MKRRLWYNGEFDCTIHKCIEDVQKTVFEQPLTSTVRLLMQYTGSSFNAAKRICPATGRKVSLTAWQNQDRKWLCWSKTRKWIEPNDVSALDWTGSRPFVIECRWNCHKFFSWLNWKWKSCGLAGFTGYIFHCMQRAFISHNTKTPWWTNAQKLDTFPFFRVPLFGFLSASRVEVWTTCQTYLTAVNTSFPHAFLPGVGS